MQTLLTWSDDDDDDDDDNDNAGCNNNKSDIRSLDWKIMIRYMS
jgi:hypothetical protein